MSRAATDYIKDYDQGTLKKCHHIDPKLPYIKGVYTFHDLLPVPARSLVFLLQNFKTFCIGCICGFWEVHMIYGG
jgi:hypothetical protein